MKRCWYCIGYQHLSRPPKGANLAANAADNASAQAGQAGLTRGIGSCTKSLNAESPRTENSGFAAAFGCPTAWYGQPLFGHEKLLTTESGYNSLCSSRTTLTYTALQHDNDLDTQPMPGCNAASWQGRL
jgi:hypothetical protein